MKTIIKLQVFIALFCFSYNCLFAQDNNNEKILNAVEYYVNNGMADSTVILGNSIISQMDTNTDKNCHVRATIYHRMGWANYMLGDYPKAQSFFSNVIDLCHTHPYAYDATLDELYNSSVAWLGVQKELAVASMSLWGKVLKLNGDNCFKAIILKNFADTYILLGEMQTAISYYSQIISMVENGDCLYDKNLNNAYATAVLRLYFTDLGTIDLLTKAYPRLYSMRTHDENDYYSALVYQIVNEYFAKDEIHKIGKVLEEYTTFVESPYCYLNSGTITMLLNIAYYISGFGNYAQRISSELIPVLEQMDQVQLAQNVSSYSKLPYLYIYAGKYESVANKTIEVWNNIKKTKMPISLNSCCDIAFLVPNYMLISDEYINSASRILHEIDYLINDTSQTSSDKSIYTWFPTQFSINDGLAYINNLKGDKIECKRKLLDNAEMILNYKLYKGHLWSLYKTLAENEENPELREEYLKHMLRAFQECGGAKDSDTLDFLLSYYAFELFGREDDGTDGKRKYLDNIFDKVKERTNDFRVFSVNDRLLISIISNLSYFYAAQGIENKASSLINYEADAIKRSQNISTIDKFFFYNDMASILALFDNKKMVQKCLQQSFEQIPSIVKILYKAVENVRIGRLYNSIGLQLRNTIPYLSYAYSTDSTITLALNTIINTKDLLLQMEINEKWGKSIFNDSPLRRIYQGEFSMYNQSLFDDTTGVDSLRMLNWKEIQSVLKPNDAAIEFAVGTWGGGDSSVFLAYLILPQYTVPIQVVLFKGKMWELLNIKTRNELSNIIWGSESLKGLLSGVENIYFSPEGIALFYPIESLPDYQDTNNIISDRFKLYRVSSLKELLKKRKQKRPQTAVIFGGLSYDDNVALVPSLEQKTATNQEHFVSISNYLGDLPNTIHEANAINKISQEAGIITSLKTDSSGTELSLRNAIAEGADIVHIATHSGYLPQYSNDNSTGSDYSAIRNKAMNTWGLLLSGANRSSAFGDNNGFLTANEASRINCQGVDLLVLSSCESALGNFYLDGTFGLHRGFKKAGANAIIMSMWPVDDYATMLFMTCFYENYLIKKMTKQKALKAAQEYVRNYEVDKTEWAIEQRKQKDEFRGSGGNFRSKATTGKSKKTRVAGQMYKPFQDPKYWAAFILLDGLD